MFAISVTGYVLGSWWDLDVESLNTVTVQVLLPALAFHSIATSSLDGAATTSIAVGVVAFILAMVFLALAVGRLVYRSESLVSALVLASAFPNSGNFGIPLAEFAFGAVGRTTAVLFVTVQNVLVYTMGAYIASRGRGTTGVAAVRSVIKLPLVYAAGAAVLVRWAGWMPPAGGSFMSTLGLMGDASIPLMLMILGIKLAEIDIGDTTRVVTPSVLKLILAPVVGLGVVSVVGFENPTVARVFILASATPAAVLPLILALTYGDRPLENGISTSQYISTTILVTTVASIGVLSLLIVLLRSGVFV